MNKIAIEKLKRGLSKPQIIKNKIKQRFKFLGLDYRWGKGYSFLPTVIFHSPTLRCNISCIYCNIPQESQRVRIDGARHYAEELEWEKMDQVLENYSFFKPNVNISGGEPLLYPHIIKMLRKLALEKNLCVNLSTNGVLLADIADEILNSGITSLIISIDGIGEQHDKATMKGTFGRVMNGIDRVKILLSRSNGLYLNLVSISVINQHNYMNLLELVKELHKMGFKKIQLHHRGFDQGYLVEKHNRVYDDPLLYKGWIHGGITAEEQNKLIDVDILYHNLREVERFAEAKGIYLNIVPNLTKEVMERLYQEPSQLKPIGNGCKILWHVAYIMPNGQVFPSLWCFFHPLGSLLESRFCKIWNNEEYRKIRRYLVKEGYFDICGVCLISHGAC